MTKSNLYVDVSVLQTVPSSNINRDDTGAPKTALYGGVSRARVSSQSWKKAVRDAFKQDNVLVGTRTKKAASLLGEELKSLNSLLDDDTVATKVSEIFKAAGIKLNKDNETGALLLVSHGQINKLAQYALDNEELDKKAVKSVLTTDHSLDLALFGRMVADNPELNVDASAQVAHAVSTHEVVPEYDYFTALDDEQPKDNAGAAMLGSIDFNSATLYRYANVNVNELAHNLNATDAVHGVADFIKDFVLSMPTGKQNTFANKTLPSYVLVTIRTDTPVNLVSAFEAPVSAAGGYIEHSIEKLEAEYQRTSGFVEEPSKTLVLGKTDSQIGTVVTNLSELLEGITDKLSEVVQDEDTND
ncbi:type I-E CRISPR-associated protein Cas7/Cse4/CasC [Levilactobacillus yonginensis]|uniref:type I-E CRISPR-associated protein Cas7/Cse4/CasC n=1 Tax=Levilactobacillus yonginensis TaxID=1054041 RepID=UPI000F7B6DAE|nr:type I-E CRISPR-associated protein Cas7/Cse4/CasC [Levilactobacillus yonginensis]